MHFAGVVQNVQTGFDYNGESESAVGLPSPVMPSPRREEVVRDVVRAELCQLYSVR